MFDLKPKLKQQKLSYVYLVSSEVHDETIGPTSDNTNEKENLDRNLEFRHVNMMALAGAIGTGLIIGTGSALVRGGPASLFIAYTFTGGLLLTVLLSLAEMASFSPMQRAFSGYAARYVDPALGFAAGWNYFFKYAIVLATNLTATGLIIQYWRPDLNVGIWIAVFLVAVLIINFFNVTFFGELEFWSALAKLITLAICFITCLVITCGGAPDKTSIGFRYWRQEPFREYLVTGSKGRFLGFWACIVQSCFAYVGSEAVGVVFGETPNPKKFIPRASRQVFFRIGFFYVIGVFLIGLSVSGDNPLLTASSSTNASTSPFVVAMKTAEIKVLPDFINACLLIFVGSAANTDIYLGLRALYGLAKDGLAPKFFLKLNRFKVPYVACLFTSSFGLLGFLNTKDSASTIFGYFSSSVTVFGTITWISILVSYIGFYRATQAQGITRDQIPFRMWGQPYSAIVTLFFVCTITFFNGYSAFILEFNYKAFITSYIGIAAHLVMIFGYKLVRKSKYVAPQDAVLAGYIEGQLFRDEQYPTEKA